MRRFHRPSKRATRQHWGISCIPKPSNTGLAVQQTLQPEP
jgi:hypothetical protein